MKYLTLLFFVVLSYSACAQIEPVFFEEVDLTVNPDVSKMHKLSNGNWVLSEVPYRKNKMQFFLFGADGKLIREGSYEPKDKSVDLYSTYLINDQIFVSCGKSSKTTSSESQSLISISMEDFSIGDEREFLTVPGNIIESNKEIQVQMEFFPSSKSRFYKDSIITMVNDYANQQFTVKVMGLDLEVIQSEVVDVKSWGYQYARLTSWSQDNQGRFRYHVLLYNWKEGKGNEYSERIDDKYIWVYGDDSTPENLIEDVNLEYLESVPEEVQIYSLKGELSVGGYFSYDEATNKEYFHSFNVYTNEGKLFNINTHCFDPEYLWPHSVDPWKKYYEKAISKGKTPRKLNMYISSFKYNDEDESITYFLDQNYQMENTNDRKIYSNLIYHFGNVLALSYDKNGDFQWKQIIPKAQIASGRSRKLGVKYQELENGDLLLLFNNLDGENKMNELHLVSITSDGEVTELMNYVFDKKQEGITAQKFKWFEDCFVLKFNESKGKQIIRIPIR